MSRESHPDLRAHVRLPLHLSVDLKTPTAEYLVETRDVSAGGISFQTTSEITVGSPVEFTIEMPGEAVGKEHHVFVKCQGRVVRCTAEDGVRNVAVVIDDYQFHRTDA